MGLTSARPLQTAFKSAPGRFVTRITYRRALIGMMSLIRDYPTGQCRRCSKWFTTNLSFDCRFPATRTI
ncbi:hypothetical protein DVQ84_07670 [Yersinia enterocolitica]|nr:hypothetical protein [Yersinia enterocolitica]QBP99471.1 hypothetical protein YEY1_12200 [Yersinia enterocolitica subsp. palearctica]EKN5966423.1 hypothetical protein [Yersinia enterocolitica]EKN6017708.1 hypothetical protein [Yersinia enterocolitica]EKN6031203.1 hypothetical protein [Yersinia enterocolitica]